MPLPFIAWAGIAAGAAAVSACTAYYYYEDAKRKKRKIKFLVVGPKQAGKSTLCHFLQYEKINSSSEETKSRQEYSFNYWVVEKEAYVGVDVDGSKDAYRTWRDSMLDSDYIFYIFRYIDLFSGESSKPAKRMSDDFYQLRKWQKESNISKKIIVVLTHADKIEKEFDLGEVKSSDLVEKAMEVQAMKKAKSYAGAGNFEVVVGSLDNVNNAKKLVAELFKVVK